MRISIVVPSLRQTAPVVVGAELAQGLVRRGHDVTLHHLDPITEFDPQVPTQHLDRQRLTRLGAFDVVHSHMLRPDLLVAGLRRSDRQFPVLVTTLHNYVREDLRNTHGWVMAEIAARLWMRAWKRFDARVVLSRDAAGYYERLMPRATFACVPNGRSPHPAANASVAAHEALSHLRTRHKIIGANALVSRRKGLEQVIRALPMLPEYAFVLVGDGPALSELIELAAKLGVAERFLPLGFRPDARLYLDYYDLYVMPSRSEGLPLAILEAAAAKKSIVCSRLPVFEEVFDSTQASFFALDDVADLVVAVHTADADRGAKKQAAYERFCANYSLDAMVEGYLDIYKNCRRNISP